MLKKSNTYFFIVILIIFSVSFSFAQQSLYKLTKPVSSEYSNFAGDNQHQSPGLKTEKPIRVLVEDAAGPVEGVPVTFCFVRFPDQCKGHKITDTLVYTDKDGFAETFVTLGNKKGDYEVIAKVDTEYQVFVVHSRKSNWVFLLVIGLLGGLGLFLLGMHMMSEGMQKSAGDRMRTILSSLTNNRFVAVGVGAFVTMIIQSSSATAVMLVSFVHSGLMRFSQTIGVILGAAIGTTITAQLIAFKLTDYALLFVALGFGLNYFSKKENLKNIGQAVLGFGILFYGMHIMSESMYPLRSYEPFIDTIVRLENPALGVLAGALFTALVQSSSAFIGIMIILATQGLLSLEASIPLVLGANLGTAITAILASINTNREAKKVALAQTIYKLAGVVIFLLMIPLFAEMVLWISPKSPGLEGMNAMAEEVPRQIANAHTIFNIIITLLFLPFTRNFAMLIHRMLPKKEKQEKKFKVKYLDNNIIGTPALALNLAKQEVVRMANITQDMVNDIILAFFLKDKKILEEIIKKEDQVDYLRTKINSYLLKISNETSQEMRAHEAFQIMYTVKEIEQIGDLVATNLRFQAEKWVDKDGEFSEEGKKELMDYHVRAQKQISRAIEVFRDLNLEKAQAMKAKYKKYRAIANEFELSHYERLFDNVDKSVSSSKTHLEIIGLLKAITSHATNIARIHLEWNKEKSEED